MEYFKKRNSKKKKAFTLIELIVVIAILGVLIILAAPKLLGYTEHAKVSELTSDINTIQTASVKYYLENNDWPRLTDGAYTADEIEQFAERIYNITGEEIELDPNGYYYDIDYSKLPSGLKLSGNKANYVLQSRGGKIYSLYEPNESFVNRVPSLPNEDSTDEEKNVVPDEILPDNAIDPDKNLPNNEENVMPDNEDIELTNNGTYTPEEIEYLVSQGYVEISTAEDLNNVKKGLKRNYIQTSNIDLSSYSSKTNWKPIGGFLNEFEGVYDGGGFKITGLNIDSRSSIYVGLFGWIDGAEIKNVGLEDVSLVGWRYVGALAGYSEESEISNSYSTGIIEGRGSYTGGLVGYSENSNFSDSYTTTTVEGIGNYVGGLAGLVKRSEISRSYATGSVKGRNYVGGLAGYVYKSTLSESYATGFVSGKETRAGGLIGYKYNSEIEKSYYDFQTTGQVLSRGGNGESTSEMRKQKTYSGWDFKKTWRIEENVSYPTLLKH